MRRTRRPRGPRPAWLPVRLVAALTVGLAGLAAVLAILAPGNPAVALVAPWWAVTLPAIGFFAAELVVFNVEYRRETISFSLAEVPLAFALVFLGPTHAIVARVVGSLLAHLVGRRPNATKLIFNASLFAAETALASMIVGTLTVGRLGRGDMLLALLLAIGTSSAFGGIMVSLAVTCFEGDFRRRITGELRAGWVVYVLGAVTGVVSVTPALIDWRLAVLPAVPVLAVWRLLIARGTVGQQFRDLEDLHAFSSTIGQSLDLDRVIEVACHEMGRLLRAEHAGLVVFDSRDGRIAATATIGDPGTLPDGSNDPTWVEVLHSRDIHTVIAERATWPGRHLFDAGRAEGLAASIADDQGVLGLVILADRSGALTRFTDDDRHRLTPLLAQLAVSLRKVALHLQVEREATHDRLTGLPARALLESGLEHALALDRPVGVFMLDIDRFKEINDTLGHHTGDGVLCEFARRVRAALGPDDTLARFAGDEFAIIALDCDQARGGAIAQAILEELRRPFDVGDLAIAVACSVGVALAPRDGVDGTTLLRRADRAMYDAKGRSSGFELYRRDMDSDSADRLAMLGELRAAFEGPMDQIEVHFQPKIDLARGQVVGAEALVRWQHPRHGLLAADRFIGLAERTDLIHRLSEVVLGQSLKAVRHWRDQGYELGIAVNYSARSLFDELLADRIARQLELYGVPATLLTIEVTESSVMTDVKRAAVVLERLKALGVKISVDDYGTGYSSLAYLRRLPVTELKIDRAFITNLLIEADDEIIVRSTIELARHLGLQVVAEGIEAAPVAARLHELGCQIGQGYGFSRPLPLAKFDAWMAISELRPTPTP